MSKRYIENEKNSPYKRGTVIERKPGFVKVQFDDEDGDVSNWISVGQGGGGTNKIFAMPDIGTQVSCVMDWDGEDGTVIGAIYEAPTGNLDDIHMSFASGVTLILGKGSGDVSVTGANNVSIEAVDILLRGNVAIEGGTLTHDGVNVGKDHKHTDVTTGEDESGEPT